MFRAKARQSISDRDMRLIKAAHEIVGLDFNDEDDSKAFRAKARNAFRQIFDIDDETVYRMSVYVWYARTLID